MEKDRVGEKRAEGLGEGDTREGKAREKRVERPANGCTRLRAAGSKLAEKDGLVRGKSPTRSVARRPTFPLVRPTTK